MKHRIVLLAAITAALLCGCQSAQQSSAQDTTAASTLAPAVTQAAPATEATQQTAAQALSSDTAITEAAAKAAALADAGLTEADVTFTECKQELDDGVQVYEIEFVSGTTEYDYKIDTATGAILEKDQENVND